MTFSFNFGIMLSMKQIFFSIVVLLTVTGFAEKQPIERYQSIIDRQMFGELPHGFDSSKLPSEVVKVSDKELTKEQEAMKSAIHFSVINVMADGTVEVGFTDNSLPNTPKHYFIKEGESAGGWTVESADPDSATMVIVKNGVDLTLSLGDDSSKGAGTITNASETSSKLSKTQGAFQSLRERRLLRAKELEREADARAKRLAEESSAREAEREAEREARAEEQRQQIQAMKDEIRLRLEEAKKATEAARAVAEKSEENNEEASDDAN